MAQITARDKSNKDHVLHSKRALVPEPVKRGQTGSPPRGNIQQPASGGSPHGSKNPQTVSSINFTAATFPDCSGFPPDTMGTVGPSQFIIALNGRIRSFNKTTGAADNAINVTTDSFYGSVMTPADGTFSSDPRIRYDRLSGRWFISMIDVPSGKDTSPNRIMLAVSSSSVISNTSTWTFFQFRHDLVGTTPNLDTGAFADYPTLAIDTNALYLGVNVFTNQANTPRFFNTTLYVVQKSSLLSGGPIVVTPFRGLITAGTGIFTPHGADNYDPAATEGYVIGIDRTDRSILQLLRVSNPGGTPAISPYASIPIDLYTTAILVQHLGNSGGTNGYLDFVDQRLMAAHYRNGLLWTCHNVGLNNTGGVSTVTRDGVQWFAITNIPTGLTPAVSQSGTVYQSTATNSTTARSYWMGTIMVSGQGHAAMGFSSAGASDFINAATCGRFVNDPPGTMQSPVLYTSSHSVYNPSGDTGGSRGRRWGDYSFTSVDPSDDMTMWTIQEFCSSTSVYGVRVAKLLAPPPPASTNCSPALVNQGATNVTVVISAAASTNGDGFFDPGSGFSRRPSLAFSGNGIVVNSFTVTDPLTLTANLTVASNAQAGGRSVTFTNPDGQTLVGASNVLTIVPGSINNPPMLAALPSYTLTVGTTLAFTNTAADPDSPPETLSFSLDVGAPTNATLDSATGAFSWAPNSSQLGTNLLSIIVTDNGTPPLSATQTFSAIVVLTNHPPVLAHNPDRTIASGMILNFTNSATDPDSPPSTLIFIPVSIPFNATLNSSNGVFTWPAINAQIGTNLLSIAVSDNGLPPLSATQSFTVVILPSNNPPVLSLIANRTIHQGATLLITNTASDPDAPPQNLTFSFVTNAPAGASIDAASGLFTWSPAPAFLNTTNQIGVRVTDNGLPPLSDTKSFTVAVVPRPLILSAAISNANLVLTWTAIPGQAYRLQFKQNADDAAWNDLTPDVTASSTTGSGTDPFLAGPQRFFRVRVLP